MFNFLKRKKQPNNIIYPLRDIFTPSSAAQLTYVERGELDTDIRKALEIKGLQVIMYGHSGSGKTTVIRNILANLGIRYITTNCTKKSCLDDIIVDGFDQLNTFITSEVSNSSEYGVTSEIKTKYGVLEADLKAEMKRTGSSKRIRLVAPQHTAQRLAEILGASNVVWILEDFHKVELAEKQSFSQTLKVFVDVSNNFPNFKSIAIGAVHTAREVVNYDPELNNRIAEIHVPLMSDDELRAIVDKGEKLLNIVFDEETKVGIVNFSNSLAAICHRLCYNICYNSSVTVTQTVTKRIPNEQFREAVLDYLKQNSDSFKEMLEKALKPREGKYDRTKELLKALCNSELKEMTSDEIADLSSIKATYRKSLSEYLRLLTTCEYGEILRCNEDSGKYFFSNPFFHGYLKMQFSVENIGRASKRPDVETYEEILRLISKMNRERSIYLTSEKVPTDTKTRVIKGKR